MDRPGISRKIEAPAALKINKTVGLFAIYYADLYDAWFLKYIFFTLLILNNILFLYKVNKSWNQRSLIVFFLGFYLISHLKKKKILTVLGKK